ncbi:hypothetical protein FRC12_008338 [Ceratobasidium sp. 428]|nr:hypothetical protein FRC12_008338 [Ceratobasidium sp. 428]
MPRESLHSLPQQLQALGYTLPHDLWAKISNHNLLELCDSLRSCLGTQRGVPSRFLSSQPVLPHMNPNIMPAAFMPESYLESVVFESAWEAVIRVLLSPVLSPLTSVPTESQLSILDKSRLLWGGVGAGIMAPRCVRSIAPLISALQTACALSLNSLQVLGKQDTLNSIQGIVDCADVLRGISEACFVDYAAIRALVRLVCEVLDGPEFPKDLFQESFTIANDLLQETTINSGEAMLEMWTAMKLPALSHNNQAAISKLFASSAQQSQAHRDIRRKAIDIAAMLHLRDSDELTNCASKLITTGGNLIVDNRPRLSNADHAEVCVSALNVIADALDGTLSSQLNEAFFDVVSGAPRNEWSLFAYLRILIWEKESSTRVNGAPACSPTLPGIASFRGYSLSTLFGTHLGWMQACWFPSEKSSGSELLLKSAEHFICQKRCAASLIDLGYHQQYREALQNQGAHLRLQAYSANDDRLVSIAVLWVHAASLIFAAFDAKTTPAEQSRVADIQAQLSSLPDRELAYQTIFDFVDLLEGCTVPLLARVSKKHLSGLRNTVFSVSADDFELTGFLGKVWISTTYMLLELYFPEIPMDPLGGQTCQSLVWKSRLGWLNTHIHTLTLGQNFVHSVNYEQTIGRLRDRLSVAQDQYTQFNSTIARGPGHLQQLSDMFTEVHSFLSQVIGYTRVSQLVQSIENDAQNQDFLQEEMMQGTITTFLHRLRESYSSLVDIILPVEYALHQLKFGLRMCASVARSRSENRPAVSDVTRLMLYKPTVLGYQALIDADLATLVTTVPLSVSVAEWITAKAQALLLSCDVNRAPHFAARHLIELYDQFLHLWISQRTRDTRAEEESQGLYKQKKTESSGLREEEELEREFKELFPSFDDVLDGSGAASEPRGSTLRSTGLVNDADIRATYDIHTTWANFTAGSRTVSSRLNSIYARSCRDITSRIAQNYEASLDTSVDTNGFCQRIQITQTSLDSLLPKMDPSFDFYHDANLPEITKAARLLDNFRIRLDVLISEWPDQMVLRHLHERSQAISQFRLDTPLAKVLSALEQLLLHTDDWQNYANKDNTLKVQQQELADLIVDWRRLELKCWSTLLDREMSLCAKSVSTWWPQLYESIVSVAASLDNSSAPENIAGHLAQLVSLLDSYLTQSPLGQFEPRLALLQSFAKLARSLSTESVPSNYFLIVSGLLDTLCLQYLEMLPSVQSSLAMQRNGVDKEIGDFIKLASWKDTNVYALKQSAEKTHRVLYKCIRKFRSIVRQPVSEVLASHPSNALPLHNDVPNLDGDSSAETTSLAITYCDAAPSSLLENINIERALQNYQLHAKQSTHWLVHNAGTEVARILAARIVAGLKELSEATIPENSETRERHIKALVSRKRRAWGDLLKELKRLGLAVAVTADTLSQQEDRATLLSLSLNSDNHGVFSSAVLKSNKQFVRLLEVIPDMRMSLHQHHSDISTRDFHRASSLVESSFSIVIEARKRRVS